MSVAGVAHPVERHLAKVEVASSSLVTRSINAVSERKRRFLLSSQARTIICNMPVAYCWPPVSTAATLLFHFPAGSEMQTSLVTRSIEKADCVSDRLFRLYSSFGEFYFCRSDIALRAVDRRI